MSYTSWQPTSHDDYETLKGFDVYTSDDEKLGTIKEVVHPTSTGMDAAIGGHYFRVEPGTLKKLFSDQDEVFVSETMIRDVRPEEDKVILSLRKESVQNTDWSRPVNTTTTRH